MSPRPSDSPRPTRRAASRGCGATRPARPPPDSAHELIDAVADSRRCRGRHFPALFEALLAGAVVRPRLRQASAAVHLGPLEARLQQADLLILGGLNEGTWPAESGHRSLDEPADAPGLRPAAAGAQDRSCRARFPAGDGRAERSLLTRAARARGRADRAVALAAAARCGAAARPALDDRTRARPATPRARRSSTSRPSADRAPPPGAVPAAGGAAGAAVGHPDRDVAAQSLCDLCAAHPAPEGAGRARRRIPAPPISASRARGTARFRRVVIRASLPRMPDDG